MVENSAIDVREQQDAAGGRLRNLAQRSINGLR